MRTPIVLRFAHPVNPSTPVYPVEIVIVDYLVEIRDGHQVGLDEGQIGLTLMRRRYVFRQMSKAVLKKL